MSELQAIVGRCDLSLQREGFRLQAKFDIPAQGITGLFGPSGSGKTTVLRCLAGLERQASGQIQMGNVTWQNSSDKKFTPPHRRDVGYVFQGAPLFPHLDVAGNIDYGQRRARQKPGYSREHICELLGITALVHRHTGQLSGGEKHRVAIARAVLRAPRLLLMDEPLTGIDQDSRLQIYRFLDRLHTDWQIPIVYVTHSLEEITHLCDHLIVMRSGQMTHADSIETLLTRQDVFGEEKNGVLLRVIVDSYDAEQQLSRIRFDGGELLLPGKPAAPGEKLRLRILARDVSLSLQPTPDNSILNQLMTTVVSILDSGGPHVQIELKLGQSTLLARITRFSLQRLALAVGRPVIAQIKGVAVKSCGPVGLDAKSPGSG